jgi:hypothetical protein
MTCVVREKGAEAMSDRLKLGSTASTHMVEYCVCVEFDLDRGVSCECLKWMILHHVFECS